MVQCYGFGFDRKRIFLIDRTGKNMRIRIRKPQAEEKISFSYTYIFNHNYDPDLVFRRTVESGSVFFVYPFLCNSDS